LLEASQFDNWELPMTSIKQLAAIAFAACAVVGFSASAEAYHGRGYRHGYGHGHGFYGHRRYWGHRGWGGSGYYPGWGYYYPHCYWRYGRRICWY
jgi:hypothetical protein